MFDTVTLIRAIAVAPLRERAVYAARVVTLLPCYVCRHAPFSFIADDAATRAISLLTRAARGVCAIRCWATGNSTPYDDARRYAAAMLIYYAAMLAATPYQT